MYIHACVYKSMYRHSSKFACKMSDGQQLEKHVDYSKVTVALLFLYNTKPAECLFPCICPLKGY